MNFISQCSDGLDISRLNTDWATCGLLIEFLKFEPDWECLKLSKNSNLCQIELLCLTIWNCHTDIVTCAGLRAPIYSAWKNWSFFDENKWIRNQKFDTQNIIELYDTLWTLWKINNQLLSKKDKNYWNKVHICMTFRY